jgi:hypothetical protein
VEPQLQAVKPEIHSEIYHRAHRELTKETEKMKNRLVVWLKTDFSLRSLCALCGLCGKKSSFLKKDACI